MPLLSLTLVPVLFGAVPAPVSSATVYSDRARVVRTAQVRLSGTQTVEFPLLQGSIDPDSLRVEARGAEVKRVDLAHVEATEVPLTEVRALLTALEALDDKVMRLEAERRAHQLQIDALRRLTPSLPTPDAQRPPPKLNPSGWGQGGAFADALLDKLQARSRALGETLLDLAKERETLAAKAQLAGAERRAGHRVVATVTGNGPATLDLIYFASNARWKPTYDLQLLPDKGTVQVAFSALVSQESGEDWEDAKLTLSTAIPAVRRELPQLLTWKIGERERFIPTPTPPVEPLKPPPQAPPLLRARDEGELWRERLLAKVGSPRGAAANALSGAMAPPPPGESFAEEDRYDTPGAAMESYAPAAPSMPGMAAAPAAQAPRPMQAPKRRAAPSSRAMMGQGRAERSAVAAAPPSGASLAPPPGWVPPQYGPDTPAGAAGGHDLTFEALRPETVKSGQGARRVALFAESWPVQVERKLFPALDPEAFLVAELKNPSDRALPAGPANLFVGQDPSGVATLSLIAPGQRFTLPLGRDRALRPVRNVKLKLAEKGLFSKDEVSQYDVTIEVANPYPAPMPVRILDQLPVTDDEDVTLELLAAKPTPVQDKALGSLEWQLTLPASGKSVVSFSYVLRRPKGYRMRQSH
jgi:hypothetical protein